MWINLFIVVICAIIVQLFFFQINENNGTLFTTLHAELQWHLLEQSPFVVVNNILSDELLEKVLSEIEKGIKEDYSPDVGDPSCTLRRDGLPCSNERWMSLTLEEIKEPSKNKFQDIFEHAIYSIAKIDMEEILPEYIASKVTGVSWRILVSVSGRNKKIFHYDSDEGTDYVIPETPLIYPLMSTVTYLNDYGEPTTIYEQTQMPTNSSEIHIPRAVYVCMPRQNKHIAFDSRLFHGSSAPITKHEGRLRIAIGTNFHTSQSLETINEDNSQTIIPPALSSQITSTSTKTNHDNLSINPWNRDHNIEFGIETRNKWTSFNLFTFANGFDYCGEHLSPCSLKVRLPIQHILSYERNHPGSTFGFKIQDGDFVISKMKEGFKYTPGEGSSQSKEIAINTLKERCVIYDHNHTAMVPPLNKLCQKSS